MYLYISDKLLVCVHPNTQVDNIRKLAERLGSHKLRFDVKIFLKQNIFFNEINMLQFFYTYIKGNFTAKIFLPLNRIFN